MEKQGTFGEFAKAESKELQKQIIQASVTTMLEKKPGHRWKHQAARGIGEMEITAM